MPAIVLGSRQPASQAMAVGMRQFASLIPNSRLVLFEGRQNQEIVFSRGSQLPPAVPVIEEFIAGLSLDEERPLKVQVPDGLSARELEVLRLIAQGKSNPQIAESLFITRNTVQNHVSSILIKLDVANRAQAAVYAKEHGLV